MKNSTEDNVRIFPNFLWIFLSMFTSIFFGAVSIGSFLLIYVSIIQTDYLFAILGILFVFLFGYFSYLNFYININYICFVRLNSNEVKATFPFKFKKIIKTKRQIRQYTFDSIEIGKIGSFKTVIIYFEDDSAIEFFKLYHWNFNKLISYLKDSKIRFNKNRGAYWTFWKRVY